MEEWNAEFFRRGLNQEFLVQLSDASSYPLILTEVNELGNHGVEGFRKPFSIYFRNPDRTHYLPQRIYHLSHPELGVIELFLVPLGPDGETMLYEAVFG